MKNKIKLLKKLFYISFVILLSINFFTACALLPEEEVSAPPPLIPPPDTTVIQEEVLRGYIASELSGLARVSASREDNLYFRRDGRVAEILVEQNEYVEEGQALLRLETEDLEFHYQLAKLEYEREKINFDRVSQLREIGDSVLYHEYEQQRIVYQISKLRLEKCKSDLNNSIIFSPYDARITNISVRQGQSVDAYDGAIRIVDDSEIELQMNIPRERINEIASGQKARIRLADGNWLDACVVRIITASRDNERTVILELIDVDRMNELEYNLTFRSRIILEENQNALILPRAVIREYMGRSYVRVLDGETRRDISVELGITTDTHVEILDGLEEGQIIIGN